jgi:hypothetical protein
VTLQFSAYGDMTHVFLDNVVAEAFDGVVPEPSTLVLLVSAVAAAAWRRRLRIR